MTTACRPPNPREYALPHASPRHLQPPPPPTAIKTNQKSHFFFVLALFGSMVSSTTGSVGGWKYVRGGPAAGSQSLPLSDTNTFRVVLFGSPYTLSRLSSLFSSVVRAESWAAGDAAAAVDAVVAADEEAPPPWDFMSTAAAPPPAEEGVVVAAEGWTAASAPLL